VWWKRRECTWIWARIVTWACRRENAVDFEGGTPNADDFSSSSSSSRMAFVVDLVPRKRPCRDHRARRTIRGRSSGRRRLRRRLGDFVERWTCCHRRRFWESSCKIMPSPPLPLPPRLSDDPTTSNSKESRPPPLPLPRVVPGVWPSSWMTTALSKTRSTTTAADDNDPANDLSCRCRCRCCFLRDGNCRIPCRSTS